MFGSESIRRAGRDDGVETQGTPFDGIDWHTYEPELRWLCEVKAEEFRWMGYDEVTGADIWQCVLQLTQGRRPLHQMVATILGLQPGQFMHYATLSAWQGKV
jgi:hypothetical protein